MDATCAVEMRYPVDVDIIHDGCRKVTDYIIKVLKFPTPLIGHCCRVKCTPSPINKAF